MKIIENNFKVDDDKQKNTYEIKNDKLFFKVICDVDFLIFNQTFELNKAYSESESSKILKKELFELKEKVEEHVEEIDDFKEKVTDFMNNNIKENSIIPVIKVKYDEDEVETKYKWFLDWLKEQIMETIEVDKIGIMNSIPNSLNGKDLNREFRHADVFKGTFYNDPCGNWNNNTRLTTSNKLLYYYLKKRNIILTRNSNADWSWIYDP